MGGLYIIYALAGIISLIILIIFLMDLNDIRNNLSHINDTLNKINKTLSHQKEQPTEAIELNSEITQKMNTLRVQKENLAKATDPEWKKFYEREINSLEKDIEASKNM